VVNRQEQTIRTFLKKHPDHADMPVRSSVMSMHVER
jgi:Holliday junction resolvase-like predicted endonuclease